LYLFSPIGAKKTIKKAVDIINAHGLYLQTYAFKSRAYLSHKNEKIKILSCLKKYSHKIIPMIKIRLM